MDKRYDINYLRATGIRDAVAITIAAIALLLLLFSLITTRSGDIQEINGRQYVNIEDIWYEYQPDAVTFIKIVDERDQ